MISPTPLIHIENLSYAYGRRTDAVHDFNLQVEPGRCYGLFGRNGAGKTTTIKCLLNLLRPQCGQVRLFGLDPGRREVEVKRRLTYVPDQVAFYPWIARPWITSRHFELTGTRRLNANYWTVFDWIRISALPLCRRDNALRLH